MLRISTPLPEELERLVHDTIGCCIAVHRELGPGLLEHVYERAIASELTAAHISFECEAKIPIMYRGQFLCEQRLDFVVAARLVLEIKSVEHLVPLHHAQILSYMRVGRFPVGLLINFNVPILQDGIKRKILSK
jgi:GxxExxY protein